VLGGTFDPIHLGHLLVAELAAAALDLQTVLFTPAGDPPHKQAQPKTPAYHRRAMVELAIADNSTFVLCPLDLERPGPHYSLDTVRLIRARYHLLGEECFFIIGSDSLEDLPTWHRPAELLTLCRLAVLKRPGYRPDLAALEQLLPGIGERVDWVDGPLIGLSATAIRARARGGQSIRYQVPPAVQEYIAREGVY
jgi:nicotinate-nucleotide adenylyltransferase